MFPLTGPCQQLLTNLRHGSKPRRSRPNSLSKDQEQNDEQKHEILNSNHLTECILCPCSRNPIESKECKHTTDDAPDDKDRYEGFACELFKYKYPETNLTR